MLRAIGIDLGTTKSVVAALCGGEPQAIANRAGSPITPSVLALSTTGELLVGRAARDRLAEEPALGVRSFCSRLGQATTVPFNGRSYTPSELVAIFLARLREDAEVALGEPVRRAVLTLPVSSDQSYLADLRRAAALAGLQVLRLCPAPMAAALAYSLAHPDAHPQTLLVFDLGGSYLDVAVYRLFRGALTVLGLAGEGWLGGDDLTEGIVAHLLRYLQHRRRIPPDETQAGQQELRQRLHVAAEQVKVALSTVEQASFSLSPRATGLSTGLGETLTRGQFEAMARPQLEEALAVAERAVLAGGLSRESVDGILLVGGATQVPLLEEMLAERYRQARFRRDFNPLLGVAMGAAALAGMQAELVCPTCGLANPVKAPVCRRCGKSLAGEERVCCRRCFLPNDARRQVCRKCGGSLRPALRWLPRSMSERICWRCGAPARRQRSVCAGCHAPLYGASPTGLRCDLCGLVTEAGASSCPACGQVVAPFIGHVASRSLGIESPDGSLDVVLPQGHSIPSPQPAYRQFRTLGADQRHFEIAIYEGDRPVARENAPCGRLRLALPEGLPPESVVRVAFSLDRDGTLAVRAALDDGSGTEVDAYLERE